MGGLGGGALRGQALGFGGAGGAQFVPLLHVFDVQPPAGKPGGEPGVLSVPANGQGHLGFGDDYISGVFVGVKLNIADVGGAEGSGNQHLGVGVPFNDVDFFALQFVDDALDAIAAQSDAGTYRVNALLVGSDGDFAADAGVAGDGADFDGAVADFGDFEFHQPAQQVAVGAADDDFGAALGLLHFHQQHFEVLAFAVALVADLVLRAHYAPGAVLVLRLMRAEVDEHNALFNAFNAAADQLALIVGVFLKDFVALSVAEPLQDNLARRLRGDAAGVVGNFLGLGDFLADSDAGADGLGFGQADFGFRELNFLNDGAEGKDADVAGIGVEFYGEVLPAGRVIPAESGSEGNFNGAEHLVFGQAALSGQLIQRHHEIAFHRGLRVLSKRLLVHSFRPGRLTIRKRVTPRSPIINLRCGRRTPAWAGPARYPAVGRYLANYSTA